MSWSFSGVGKPEAIVRAIDKAIEGFRDQSRKEFEDAAPHLKALVAINQQDGLLLNVTAGGHASFNAEGVKLNGYCAVTISQLYGFVE